MKFSFINVIQALLIFTLGGWIAGVCVEAADADQTILAAIFDKTAFQTAFSAAIGGSICALILAWFSRGPWAWPCAIGIAPVLMVFVCVTYFLLWPYDGHGRSGLHKTVMAFLAAYWLRLLPISIAVTTSTVGVLRSFGGDRSWKNSFGFWGVAIFSLIVSSLMVVMVDRDNGEVDSTPFSRSCCSTAYGVFVKKVGVSYAIHQSEMYCEASCPEISDCLDQCMLKKEGCLQDRHLEEEACKQAHRDCTWSCPSDPVAK